MTQNANDETERTLACKLTESQKEERRPSVE